VNLSNDDFKAKDVERVFQKVIAKHEKVSWEEVIVLEESERCAGGF